MKFRIKLIEALCTPRTGKYLLRDVVLDNILGSKLFSWFDLNYGSAYVRIFTRYLLKYSIDNSICEFSIFPFL